MSIPLFTKHVRTVTGYTCSPASRTLITVLSNIWWYAILYTISLAVFPYTCIYQYISTSDMRKIWHYGIQSWNLEHFFFWSLPMNDLRYGTTSVSPCWQNDFVYAITGSYLLKNQHHFCIKTSILRFKGQQTFRGRLNMQNTRLINYWKFHTHNSQKHRFLAHDVMVFHLRKYLHTIV